MKVTFATLAAVLALAAVGCEDKSTPPAAPKPATGGSNATKAPSVLDKAKESASNVASGAANTAAALKEQAVAATTTSYEAAKKGFDDLSSKVSTLPATVKPTMDQLVSGAKDKLAAAEKALSDLKASSGDAWKSASDAAAKAVAAASDAVKAAMDKMPK